jgi:hypothetical protein
MSDEAGRFTAEHTVMESGMEIRELKHLLEVRDKKIKELEKEIVQLKGSDTSEGLIINFDDVDKSEDEFTEQLSFKFNQE